MGDDLGGARRREPDHDAERDPFPPLARPAVLGVYRFYGVPGELRRIQGDGLGSLRRPRFARVILDHLVDLKEDGSFRLDQRHFDYCTGLRMTNDSFAALFGVPPRKPEDPLEPVHMDLAASIQRVTEEVILRLTRALATETGARNLCLAGGVALNCVANGRVLRDGRFDGVWIQPAAGDAGGALGAALAAYHRYAGR